MIKEIKFYGERGDYGCFSNFYRKDFIIGMFTYSTVEHYFQSMKFAGLEYEQTIIRSPSPSIAKKLGNSRAYPIRTDWEDIKNEVMYVGVTHKFKYNKDLMEILLSTEDAQIIENSPYDYYWGIGSKGNGKNMLGKTLMNVRTDIRKLFSFLKGDGNVF